MMNCGNAGGDNRREEDGSGWRDRADMSGGGGTFSQIDANFNVRELFIP